MEPERVLTVRGDGGCKIKGRLNQLSDFHMKSETEVERQSWLGCELDPLCLYFSFKFIIFAGLFFCLFV